MLQLLLFTIAILLNFYVIHSPVIGLIVGVLYLFVYGKKFGMLFFRSAPKIFQRPLGALLFLCAVSIIGSVAYYFYKINAAVFIGTLIVLPLAIELPLRGRQSCDNEEKPKPMNWPAAALMFFYLISAAACFYLLLKHRVTDSIASPWHVLPHKFFAIFAVATAALILFILKNNQRKLSFYCSVLHTFLFSSVAFFVYKLGFGYDPFVHLATMRHIQQFGTITPTLYYYIGEYSIILFLTNLLQISIETLNQLLLPILFSVFLPLIVCFSFNSSTNVDNIANSSGKARRAIPFLLIFSALFLPVTFFINTTPQGIANLLALLVVFLSIKSRGNSHVWPQMIFSVAACFIHPFFGAPLLIYSLYCLGGILNARRPLKILWRATMLVGAAFIFPILFLLNQLLNGKTVSFIIPSIKQLLPVCNTETLGASFFCNPFTIKKQFDFTYDLLYVYGFNYKIFFLIIAIIGAVLVSTKNRNETNGRGRFFAPTIFAAIFGVNYFIMRTCIDIRFLTGKEISDYLGRIGELSFYFLLPLFLYACARFFTKLLEQPNKINGAFIAFLLTTTTTASLYISYPIFDNYKNSKFWSIGKSDISAVQYINNDTATACHAEALEACDYMVLSNQMVAAAALKEFGFKKYFGGEFYYSIPNANPDGFYKYFLEMMENDPTRETATTAMDEAGVNQLYFIANKYWRDSTAIIKKAKTTANRWQSIDDKVFVFYYSR